MTINSILKLFDDSVVFLSDSLKLSFVDKFKLSQFIKSSLKLLLFFLFLFQVCL